MNISIGLYKRMSGIKWLRSYSAKFLFLILIVLHFPLLGIIVLTILTPADTLPGHTFILCAIGFTLISAIVIIYLSKRMLSPIQLMKSSLEDFLKERKLPDLPAGYNDEIGVLMRDLQSAVAQLHLLMETKNDVIELISHDLRSPASSMLGLISVIENRRSSDQELVGYCEKLKGLVSKQLFLTNGILDSLKQEESLVENKKENVPVKLLFDTALHTFSEDISRKKIEVLTDIPEQLIIKSDALQMQEVLNNLLHNAVKFSHQGGKILVKAKQESDKVKMQISDNGIGMEMISPELLFKRFTKYSRNGTEGEPTSGLGLFICRKIIEKHGGTITASSEGSNKGSTFTISLPLS